MPPVSSYLPTTRKNKKRRKIIAKWKYKTSLTQNVFYFGEGKGKFEHHCLS